MEQGVLKVISVLVSFICPVALARCTSIPYPRLLKECYDDISQKFSPKEHPGELPTIICINKFRWWTDSESCHEAIQPACLRYIQDISYHDGRYRRGAKLPQKRKRKEIRMMTKMELKKFFKALKLLKTKKVEGTDVSLYDAIAGIHNGNIARTAHIGPNFLPWHRIYLYAFETALHEVVPGVIMPYWDCTLDQGLETPKLSKFFTKAYLGKAKGKLKKAKYGTGTQWNIIRNIETGGPLPSRLDVMKILTRDKLRDIVVPFARAPYNLEYLHNGIHTYVGGHLSTLEKATADPIFFLLHGFIDYVFEKFRQRQKSLGIDPTRNLPDPGEYYLEGLHQPFVNMSVFENYTNADGYSDYWTDEVYEYEDSPNFCDTDCGSDNLVCIHGLCYPKTGPGNPIPRKLSREEWGYFREGEPPASTADDVDKTPNQRRKRSAIFDYGDQVCSGPHCPGSDSPIQNIFTINGGKSDIKNWVFIPVTVTFFRPWNLHFHAFEMHNDSIDVSHDLFDPSYSNVLQSSMRVGHQGAYHKYCRVNGGGAGKVFVRSDGINYSGSAMEYALVDERHPISKGTAYVPIKSPAESPTEVSLIAYDECGRTCLPTCLVKGSSPPRYAPCTGCFRVDNLSPTCHGKRVSDLVYNTWNFGSIAGDCPSEEKAEIMVNFLCDSSDLYPWDRI